MTVVVGYLAGKGGAAALHLGVGAARTLNTSLAVATVVPRPWLNPSPARVDAEYAQYAAQLAASSAEQARQHVSALDDRLDVSFHKYAHRSVSGGLLEAVDVLDAELLVLGSASDGQLGQVVVGSTADRLLHSCPVPLAIGPRGYRRPKSGALVRITCAYPGSAEAVAVVRQVADLSHRLDTPMRVVTFAVRGRNMYPPTVGLHAEDAILQGWAKQAQQALTRLKDDKVIRDDVDLQVVTGNDWSEALDATDWLDGEILAIGTTPGGAVARVFLGSHGSKILRHSPVPVLVLPG
ncbi:MULTISPECIES: universal stress protein [unclassified Mycolicibacterium]|uniref:universal stress protein n=1 Tax=unclassified Mycolicibacterium TaxID=2636767 RepID=UPI0012DE3090|nr:MULTISPECIES: universal stress protein [unclassified Mycolicibacterium]MUL81473.1 universal stress protein [Mycolicibacterium sp. CBMA 329]MUL87239.1 universal stress protein [Mycolicibacterium sp. CBMA 331]MUL98479.1 universal stress protein [Mycolicibacterium sp. CBMA 334]MUM25236.1 universal stress protein [Mycolicibacterium sp. CBMA 295]MUM37536.1 universal stress protein [Mycolicibacterium sp. CBMA 247]